MSVKRLKLLAPLVLSLSLAGCVELQSGAPMIGGGNGAGASDRALAAIAKGDYGDAERLVGQALQMNPNDPYALLAAAMVYQNTGRPDLARQYYEVLATLRPQATATIGGAQAGRSVADIARDALAGMEAARKPAPAARMAGYDAGVPPPTVSGRFATLRQLLDNGLITPEEHETRRQANLGALLPYSAPPPAIGLERPAPSADQVGERLQALARSLASGAVSAQDYSKERHRILDALVPTAPTGRGAAPPPPTSPGQAAAALDRLGRLTDAGLVQHEEAERERAVIGRALQNGVPGMAGTPAASSQPTGLLPSQPAAPAPAAMMTAGPAAAVHLASFGSEDAARKAWDQFQQRYGDLLRGLRPTVSRADLGRKGTFWRLLGGPLPDLPAAENLCRNLKRAGQYCDATMLPGR